MVYSKVFNRRWILDAYQCFQSREIWTEVSLILLSIVFCHVFIFLLLALYICRTYHVAVIWTASLFICGEIKETSAEENASIVFILSHCYVPWGNFSREMLEGAKNKNKVHQSIGCLLMKTKGKPVYLDHVEMWKSGVKWFILHSFSCFIKVQNWCSQLSNWVGNYHGIKKLNFL